MRKLIILSITAITLLTTGCMTKYPTRATAYKGVYKEKPLSVLIMPPINKTVKVEAKEYFHTTLLKPLAEAGYYVIPPFLSMEILKKESAYDSEIFLEKPIKLFGEVFGADVALFTVIHSWEKSKIGGTVTVGVEYIVKSTSTSEVLYSRKGTVIYDSSVSGGSGLGGLAASIALTALNTAATDYLPVATACNNCTLVDLPCGKYSPLYNKDKELSSGPKNFTAVIDGNGRVRSIRANKEKKKKK